MEIEGGGFLIVTSGQAGHGKAMGPTGDMSGVVLKLEGVSSIDGAEVFGTFFFLPSMIPRLVRMLTDALDTLDHD